jgi:hypothetical protein
MKKTHFIILCGMAMAIFCFTNIENVNAQAPAGHVFFVNTQYSVPGLDSTARAERNAILKEYHEKVTMKNSLILHMWTMGHFFSEDSREYVTVYEVAKFEDLTKAFDIDTELELKAWPDQKQRLAFMKKMDTYFTHHKDAIYNELPGLGK